MYFIGVIKVLEVYWMNNNTGEYIFRIDIGGTNIKLAIFEFVSQIWYLSRLFASKSNSLFIIILAFSFIYSY